MKTFKDLEFKNWIQSTGVVSRIQFDNKYGASVVKNEYSYGGKNGLYELAVIDSNGNITYDTPITNDVIGYLTEDEVTTLMEQIQKLTKL